MVINPKEIGLFEVTRESSEYQNNLIQDDTLKISNNDAIIKFVDVDSEKGVMRFNVID